MKTIIQKTWHWIKSILPEFEWDLSQKTVITITPKLFRNGLIAIALFFLVGLFLWKFPTRQVRLYRENWIDKYYWTEKFDDEKRANFDREMFKIENELRGNYAQIIGGFVLLVGLYLTWRKQNHEERTSNQTLRLTEDGKITERYSKAIELLGSDNPAMRIGGIYALERIARDSEKDHWTVMEALCAFIRDESNKTTTIAKKAEQFQTGEVETKQPKLRSDIQIALTVIARRSWTDKEKLRGLRLDLTEAKLSGANLFQANLAAAILTGADLIKASLVETNLTGASLDFAYLTEAYLTEADLRGTSLMMADLVGAKLQCVGDRTAANLVGAYLIRANLRNADLTGANLTEAYLHQADLRWARLHGADLRGADLRGATYDDQTQFPEGFDLAKLKSDTNEGTE